MITYVALLRGINVGGHNKISMTDLADMFVRAGFKNVTTILASGNVVFKSPSANETKTAATIAGEIRKKFGVEIFIQVWQLEEIRKIVERNPFGKTIPDIDTHWYVTFLSTSDANLPVQKSSYFRFVSIQDRALFSVLDTKKGKSTDFMAYLDKTFGKKVTTRNWNTLLKIAATKQ